jgi:acyl carrier protein
MSISSRTPEGQPSNCPVCGKSVYLEPSEPIFDAPCPHCGHLLLFLSTAESLEIMEFSEERRQALLSFLSRSLNTDQAKRPADTPGLVKVINDLGADSLDVVEVIMELEEEGSE